VQPQKNIKVKQAASKSHFATPRITTNSNMDANKNIGFNVVLEAHINVCIAIVTFVIRNDDLVK
jgi:hypothetical protein